MPAWSAIFIDTCILEAQKFDFGSAQIEALVAATKGTGIKLLLPHPTELEIERHIENLADGAAAALKTVRKEHPFVRELTGFPQSREDQEGARQRMRRAILASWRSFQGKFELVTLDYSTIDLREVMGWYDSQRAPFGSGEKRKEFPDAFAFAALRNYARARETNIAVVSSDKDFTGACSTVPLLHHFPSLASLTNSLLEEEARFEAAVKVAKVALNQFKERIKQDFPDRGFYHDIDPDGNSHVDDVEVVKVEIEEDDIEIIGLGHEAFTVSFRATVTFTAWAQHVDPDSWVSSGEGDIMYLHDCEGRVEEEAEIDCIARVSTDADWDTVKSLLSFEIEDELITVHAGAPEVDDRDPSDCGG